MIPGLILTFLRKHWAVFAVGLAVALVYWFAYSSGRRQGVASQQPTITALNATITDVKAKTAQAQADDANRVLATERKYAAINQEKSSAYETQLAAARAAARDYADRLRNQAKAVGGGGSVSGVPAATDAASAVVGAGFASDLDVCSVNTVKAQAWLDWWKAVVKVER